jgi:hypothetical protein
LIAVAEAEFRYSDLLPSGADDTPYHLEALQRALEGPLGSRTRAFSGFGSFAIAAQ